MEPNIEFSEHDAFYSVVEEGRHLHSAIESMLKEDKVSLPAMRDLLAKIEAAPINFDNEVDQFQRKMLTAQNWLAKVRKCIPKRRQTRRGGTTDPKKMDLDTIRSLVVDAPCDDSTEMFEMQDLLDCADEWAEKVRRAIDANAADVTLDYLKELVAEGADIPVEMEERKYLEAEVAAREWCTSAASMLSCRKSIEEMEALLEWAFDIRQQIHPRKQSRWKPQVERDINAAMDSARRWTNEVRDALGSAAFEKLFSSGASAKSDSSSSAQKGVFAKKSVDVIKNLVEKAQRLDVDVSSYTTALNDCMQKGEEARAEARAMLESIGYMTSSSTKGGNDMDTTADNEVANPSLASSQAIAAAAPVRATNANSKENSQFANAVSILERVEAFPFSYEEGDALRRVVDSEKAWAERVRECVPPRQSRKKRQANNQFTESDLLQLIEESEKLLFHFPEELRIASKEVQDLENWRVKARDVIDNRIVDEIGGVVAQLQRIDLLVHEKIQTAKKKLDEEDSQAIATPANIDVKAEPHPVAENNVSVEKDADREVDVEMVDVSEGAANADAASGAAQSNEQLSANGGDVQPVDGSADSTDLKPLDLNVQAIMAHVRLESGILQKSAEVVKPESPSDVDTSDLSLLESMLTMVDDSLAAVNGIELKQGDRKTVEEMVISGDDDNKTTGDISIHATDKSVKVLEAWREQLSQVLDESDLLSVVPPEQQVLSLLIKVLDWLQAARSIFYAEPLPLSQLLESGKALQDEVNQLKDLSIVKPETFAALQSMFWPLEYLGSHEKVVDEWTKRVDAAISGKHVRTAEIQTLLDEGNGLFLEQDAFKSLLDEAKHAKMWLTKVKKRVKGLLAKDQGRLAMDMASSLVEEGGELAVELPVFDLLKEHFDAAADWETRVLGSGIETGQARIANLLALLNEYDCARFMIDLDVHRDVLKSATERYCICRQPFDGLMIGCDYCDDWFHDNCIGMSKEKAEKVEHYTCPSCFILQDLASLLEKTKLEQMNLWKEDEHRRMFEKQHASAHRRVKREERSIERNEMLLFSANNQLTQLHTRIEAIERAIASLSRSQVNGLGSPSPASTLPFSQAATNGQTAPAPVSNSAPEASANSDTTGTPSVPGTSIAPAPASSTSASSTVAPEALTLAQLPNILLPPTRPSVLPIASAAASTSNSNATSSAIAAAPSTSSAVANGSGLIPNGSEWAANVAKSPAAGLAAVQPLVQLFGPLLAAIPDTTDRLSALVATGDVEQQLVKFKGEQMELKKQIQVLQDSIALGRERLGVAQTTLKDLTATYEARRAKVPAARSWTQHVIALLNTTSLMTRQRAEGRESLLPPEYDAAITEANVSIPESSSLAALFPEVQKNVRMLRAVGWSVHVVSMMQERPEHAALSDAIAMAVRDELWEYIKTIAPLRSVLGRVDAWVARTHRAVTKPTGSTSQRLARLKQLLNEYSKLPLTWAAAADPFAAYVKMLEAPGSLSAEQKVQQINTEAVAIAALEAAMHSVATTTGGSVSPHVAAASASSSSTAATKPPRKRKMAATRKDKAPRPATKKAKPKSAQAASATTAANGSNN